MGVTRGYFKNDWYGYYTYWHNIYGYYHSWIGYANADWSVHNYDIYFGGSSQGHGTYAASLDGSVVATYTGLGFGACEAAAGLEGNPAPVNLYYKAGTYDNTSLLWQDTSGKWHTGWNTSQYWIDYPCYHGYVPSTGCFNGASYGSAHWAANRP
jgi:hypothetical protein